MTHSSPSHGFPCGWDYYTADPASAKHDQPYERAAGKDHPYATGPPMRSCRLAGTLTKTYRPG